MNVFVNIDFGKILLTNTISIDFVPLLSYNGVAKEVIKMIEMTPEIAERFLKIRKDLPGKPSREEFGSMLGITGSMVSNLDSPGRMKSVREDLVSHVCSTFNINEAWLLTGEEPMYKTGIIPELTRVLRTNPALEAMLASMLDKMTADDWAALNTVVSKVIQKEQP